ncbi:host attachment family protein [Jiella sonneratiae]|uniref:Host attachment protein n=1 Tax=Jiella sonneratiae TaxID=2816856 RepID=A0ABS3J2P8_9HYPH|nr:host attachment protein [Jiella sonneratiae]MBO0903382.1 host attachment protein [Jiella sonneratiae]
MILPNGAIVAVADGTTLKLFRNRAAEPHIDLAVWDDPEIAAKNPGSGGRHRLSSANPDSDRGAEDGFAAGIAACLNQMALDHGFDHLFLIADPRTLGELRRHFHPRLRSRIVGELSKDLTAHPAEDVAEAIRRA